MGNADSAHRTRWTHIKNSLSWLKTISAEISNSGKMIRMVKKAEPRDLRGFAFQNRPSCPGRHTHPPLNAHAHPTRSHTPPQTGSSNAPNTHTGTSRPAA